MAAKQREQLRTPHQKSEEAAQILLHLLREGLRRNTGLAPKQSAPTGMQQKRLPQQLRVTTLNRQASKYLAKLDSGDAYSSAKMLFFILKAGAGAEEAEE